jgi:hypothetical protein
MSDLERYVRGREEVLGAMRISKHVDLAFDQLAEALGGAERVLMWSLELATTAAKRVRRR